MTQLVSMNAGSPVTMSSQEIAEVVEKRHDNVKRTMERLAKKGVIRFTPTEETSHDGAGSRPVEVYRVEKRDSYVVVAQLSPEFTARLVDRWQELEAQAGPQQIPTTAEAFANAFLMIAQAERRHAEQQAAIQAITLDIAEIKQSAAVLPSCPANAESITHIRRRIGTAFGLSSSIIDVVMRECPYAPRPLGTVRNGHENAENTTYVVWNKKDVTAVFQRFVKECVQATSSMWTHPFVQGRFRMLGAREAA